MSRLCAVLLLLLVVACSPARQAAVPLPTLARLPSQYTLEDAERAASEFLLAWAQNDPVTMHRWINFAAQDAMPLPEFTALYQQTAATMTYESLTFSANTLYRVRDDVAVFNYDAFFTTRMLGSFADRARDMQLVVDPRANEWRVAWSADDIFRGMAGGGRLRLDPTVPNRANIYDRAGRALADQNGRVVLVSMVRGQARQYEQCLTAMAAALNQPVETIRQRLEIRPPDWLVEVGVIEAQMYVDTHTTLETLCGAQFDDRPVRRYINGTLAPHVLGYVGYASPAEVADLEAQGFQADSIIGRSGVEASWDATLRGQPAARLVIVSGRGEVLRELTRTSARPGESLWLTLDSDLQARVNLIVADAYTQAKDTWAPRSRGAAVVVMDVRTGEILALVSYPTFDNNAYTPFPVMGRAAGQAQIVANAENPRHPEINRAAQGVYPLGSVMKTISAAAIADAGVYTTDQAYVCNGIWNRDITRYDWLPGGHGRVTLASSLTRSCNPYYYEVGYQINQADPWLLPNYARRFGFGVLTGIGDIAEQPGLIPDPDWVRTTYGIPWTFSDAVNMSIGQGYVQVTPLQVARWFGALANGGWLMRPTLVREVGLLGETLRPAYQVQSQYIDIRPDVLATVQQGLCAVTTAADGTAEFVFRDSPLQAIGVCGKTGTAQTSGDNPSNAWFAAWAPRSAPEVAVAVLVETSGEGSAVAAPIARKVLEAYFRLVP